MNECQSMHMSESFATDAQKTKEKKSKAKIERLVKKKTTLSTFSFQI